jgi:hypothetical protein
MCRPRPRIAAIRAPASGTPTTARPHVRRHARRHRACAATGLRPRSTPQGACFMTSPDVTRTSVACEVKLYLAVPSPSSSRLALPSLTASSSSVLDRARSGAAAATLGGPAPGPKTGRSWALPTTTDRTAGSGLQAHPRHRRRASRQPRRRPAASPSATSIRSRSARSNRARAAHAP